MRRVSVIGCSGSGKTTMARAIGASLGAPVLELDSIYHQRGWTPASREAFVARVRDFVSADEWVVDGNYTSAGAAEIVWPLADTIVWMDMPRSLVVRRVLGRTLGQLLRGEELWNGNRQRWRSLVDPRARRNPVLLAWTQHGETKRKLTRARASGAWDHAEVIHLTTPARAARFSSGL